MARGLALVCCMFLSCSFVFAGATVAGAAGTPGWDAPAGPVGDADSTSLAISQQEQPAADNTITRIEVGPDGSATWTLRIRTRLDSNESVTEYRRFQDAFRANTSQYLDTFEGRMTGVVTDANDTFSREMRATEFEANTSVQEVPQRWGVVTYRFTWHGFATAEDDRLVVGDVFAGGFFIDEDDALEVAVPEGYVVEEASPTPTQTHESVAEWQGREDFADGRPRVVAVQAGDGDAGAFGSGLFVPAILVGLVIVVAVAAVGVASRRGQERGPLGALSGRFSGSNDRSGDSSGKPHDATGRSEELLTDEDRVEALLEEYGGRMKQGAVVEELDWSKSKTSRVLSDMADNNRIRKLRIGRENLIEKPENDPVDTEASHDESHRWES